MLCASVTSQKLVELFAESLLGDFHVSNDLREILHEIFAHAVRSWPQWCDLAMLNSEMFTEILEMSAVEWSTVISKELLGYSKRRKYVVKLWQDTGAVD